MSHRLWLLEDPGRERWSPFAESRPLGELLFGTGLLRERIEESAGVPVEGYLAPERLSGFREDGAPPVRSHDSTPLADSGEASALVLSSRFVPEAFDLDALMSRAGALAEEAESTELPSPIPVTLDGSADRESDLGVGWILPPGAGLPQGERGARLPLAEEISAGEGAENRTDTRIRGLLLDGPWTLMDRNPGRLMSDLTLAADGGGAPGRTGGSSVSRFDPERHPGVRVVGSHPVTVARDVVLDPHTLLDAREGPIHLSKGVRVAAFTLIEGPTWVGPDTTILGGRIASSSIGPVCKVRGEVEASVMLGFSNKAHEGYLGHALLGRWVNLGAGTTNSDLKNNYGPVRVGPGKDWTVDTGLLKVGVFLGDHVKTGIGTLLNTGTMVGTGSNLFGGVMPPQWIPPFSWGSGDRLVPFRLERFLDTARTAMGRRDRTLPDEMGTLFTHLWEDTHGGRVR